MKHLILLILTAFLLSPAASAELLLKVDLSERELVAMVDGDVVERYSIAIGKSSYPTPAGAFRIRKLVWNPPWKPPDSKWARGKSAKPAGHPDNPMKVVKMFFREPDYYIHGTHDDDSLGRAESHGCIRMHADDVAHLGQMVMQAGGKPMTEPWYRRIFRRRATKVVYLSKPVHLVIGP